MQPDSSPIPHSLLQVLWLLLASSLGWTGAELRSWLARRKREPVELDKVRAETRQIHITAENAQVGTGLEVWREMQALIQKAEQRREEWLLKEEQMRNQILFWRNKAEELDGELVDSRQANGQYQTRTKLQEYQIKRMKSLLDYHNISYAELDRPKE